MSNDSSSYDSQEFGERYASALRAHVERPSDASLAAAYELGRDALGTGCSMLELVALHLEHRRKLVEDEGVAHLPDMDRFLSEALSSFEITQRDLVESQQDATAARARAEWLGSLTDMYLAIAAHSTLDERIEEVCTQARRFLGAAEARISFGRRTEVTSSGSDSIAVRLRGGGRLTVTAPSGRKWSDPDRTALKQFAVLVSAPVDDARRLQFSQRIGRLARLLGGSVDSDEVATRLSGWGADVIGADWITLVRDGAPGAVEPAELGADVEAVTVHGQDVFHTESPDDESSVAWAALPLTSTDETLGVLVVGYDEAQPFDEVQRSFLSDVARRVTAALERSTAFGRERESRRDAETASARLRNLQELASELGRALTRRRAAEILLGHAAASTSIAGGLVVVASKGSMDVLAASGPLRSGLDDFLDELNGVLHVDSRIGRSHAITVRVAELTPSVRQHLEPLGVGAISRYRISVGSSDVTSLVVAWPHDSGGSAAHDELLTAQIGIAGPNLARAERYDSEHDIADTLQRSMLEVPPLTMPGLQWAAYYRAGSAGVAGGDWYDLIAIDDHRVGIAVGDIVGRGIEAAATMGQLRSATRALAALVPDPAKLLSELDNFAADTGHGRHSSLAYALLDTMTGVAAYSLAGHPPPLVRLPDHSTAVLDAGRGPLLGFGSRRTSDVRRLEPGTQLVLYTDGLIERRDETLDVGIRRLADTLGALGETLQPAELCQALVDLMVSAAPGTRRDDVAVVAAEYRTA